MTNSAARGPADEEGRRQLDQMAGALADVRVLLAEVRGDTSAILGRLKDHDRRSEDHEARIRSLERWRWLMTGAAFAAGAGGAELTRLLQR